MNIPNLEEIAKEIRALVTDIDAEDPYTEGVRDALEVVNHVIALADPDRQKMLYYIDDHDGRIIPPGRIIEISLVAGHPDPAKGIYPILSVEEKAE